MSSNDLERIFPGDSEMARRMRSLNWSDTPLGPPLSWSRNLKTSVRITLTSRHPMFVWWGEQLINLYNDGYAAFLCAKHPAALCQPAAIVWPEIWREIGPRAEFAMRRDQGTYDEALPFIIYRKGYPEEIYVTFSYSPIPDDEGGFGGILCPVTEETQRIIHERQLALLRELATRTADARTPQQACEFVAKALETNSKDLTFALIYLIDSERRSASLALSSGSPRGNKGAPKTAPLDGTCVWPLDKVVRDRMPCLMSDLSAIHDALPLAGGQYRVKEAIAMPILPSSGIEAGGVLIVGLNPLRTFDDGYENFLELVASGISAAITNGQAYESERRRAEALAEIDRAKTTFFSNVSHEFRTPLTLLLGPLEHELKANPDAPDGLKIAYRNSLRLLKLVNTLLDFARVEAGRMEASYEATNLSSFTTDLASVFRSAIERGGLQLRINCPPLPEPVYVDRGMWEKIVLNLLSNAFKFTFEGEIGVTLLQRMDWVELSVSDTGTGIPESELPHVFERFRRVRGTRSRTHEGAGIGLALVQELVKLHGGEIRVRSVEGRGTTFTVSIPLGTAHLRADRVAPTPAGGELVIGATPYVEEALRWLPSGIPGRTERIAGPRASLAGQPPAHILFADDNSDMRDYVGRILSQSFEVIMAADGASALVATREHRPDLVLADVMMPVMDGYSLVQHLRANPETARIPIVLLSARAGEEARVEGLAWGADDYLIKPFSARELLARVRTHVDLAQARQAAESALLKSKQQMESRVREREALLKEIHHRVKNNLQVISSLLEMQARRLNDPHSRAQLHEAYNRVASIASIHEMLYRTSSLSKIEMSAYARELATRLVSLHGAERRIEVDVSGDKVTLDLERAVACGLLLNELISNVCKHAFPDGRSGVMAICFQQDGEEIRLKIADTGVGLPPQTDIRDSSSLGLQLVCTLVEQLAGSVHLRGGPGTAIEVIIPRRTYADATADISAHAKT